LLRRADQKISVPRDINNIAPATEAVPQKLRPATIAEIVLNLPERWDHLDLQRRRLGRRSAIPGWPTGIISLQPIGDQTLATLVIRHEPVLNFSFAWGLDIVNKTRTMVEVNE
jgi:hypothetical protein